MPRERKAKPTAPRDAYTSGMGLLARREHSSRELTSKLARRGLEKSDVSAAVDKLKEKRYQSDDRFGGVIARTRVAQGYGPQRVRAELRSHGLSDAQVRAALESTEADWPAIAEAQLRRRFGTKSPADAAERVRRAQFLLRRGFDTATVRAVTRAIVDDPGEEFD